MTDRTRRLREESLSAEPSLSSERAMLLTEFYRENEDLHPVPILRALAFQHLCEHKTIWIGEEELIVGERGPSPKAVPTFPELTCHSLEDLRILDAREKTRYRVPDECLDDYEHTVIPFWTERSLRGQLFEALPEEWHGLYEAGVFTEFMEQRAPGHAVLDDKIYRRGLKEMKGEIAVTPCGRWRSPATPRSGSPSGTPSWQNEWPARSPTRTADEICSASRRCAGESLPRPRGTFTRRFRRTGCATSGW